ncbi:MAG: VPLPA-CTERM sorting domain-containing protein [Pseudomonadota bacterium]
MLTNICKKLVVLPLIFASSAALAATYNFDPVNANQNNQIVPIGDLFQLEVLSLGTNQVTFEFTNDNILSSSIIAAYIGGPSLFTDNSFVQSAGVNFNSINQSQPQTGFAIEAASSSSNQGGNNFTNGINSGTFEFLKYTLTLASGITFDSVINSINTGGLLVGVTGQTGNQGNDQYIINTPTPVSAVPVPAALPLLASAFGAFAIARRRNKAKAA